MRKLFVIAAACLMALQAQAEGWVRINQLGYLPHATKVAVYMPPPGWISAVSGRQGPIESKPGTVFRRPFPSARRCMTARRILSLTI